MKMNLGLLILAGSMALAACGASKNRSTQKQVAGEPCSVEGQRSDCAKDGFPYACGPCQGHWVVCQDGKWIPVHCDPMPRDAAIDTRNTGDVTSDISSTVDNRDAIDTSPTNGPDSSTDATGEASPTPVEGGRCLVEGQQSECAKDGYPAACGPCLGHWLYCQSGKWIAVHCEPPIPDAAVDTQRAVDVPLDLTAILDGHADSTIDESDGSADGTLRGYLVFANELYAFEACGSTNLAWADLTSVTILGAELLPKLGPVCVPVDGSVVNCPATIYVEVDGTIVSGGKYGHMSKYSQQLNIRRYLAASLTGPADCPFLPPVYP